MKQTHGLAIKQERSKVTYAALINTGFRMLEQSDLQDISVADLAKSAGYSVGAFYARFRSKDEFFSALIEEHLELRTGVQKQLYSTLTRENIIGELMHNVVGYYWEHRKFWRAVIARSIRDPESWAPMRKHRLESTRRFLDAVAGFVNRNLTEREKANIAFAFQVVLGTIDIAVVNQPGPLFMDQQVFVRELARTFRLVSDYDTILKTRGARSRKNP